MTESPWGGGETTVTIKYGKGYDETWGVFRGSVEAIRAQLIAYFEIPEADHEGLSVHDLVLNATRLAQSTSAAAVGLGGKVLAKGDAPASGGWAKAAAGLSPAEPERNPLYGLIEACADREALKDVYARNVDTFKADAELLAAWKAKGKALTA